jgi:hypothetical protein
MENWYTVPADYGGRTFSFRERAYLEWTWRRHGHEGLSRLLDRRWRRFMRRAPALIARIQSGMEEGSAVITKLTEVLGELVDSFAPQKQED